MHRQLKQTAVAARSFDTLDPTPAAYGRITDAPAANTDVLGRDGVGMPSEATRDTLKTSLRRTIASGDQAAGRTGSTRVTWIDENNGTPASCAL